MFLVGFGPIYSPQRSTKHCPFNLAHAVPVSSGSTADAVEELINDKKQLPMVIGLKPA